MIKILKRMLVAVAIVLVGLAGLSHAGGEIEVPDGYYNRPEIAAMWLRGHSLHTVLSNIEWNDSYRFNWFDCTERAFFMEFLAENAGYHAKVGCDEGHCWLLVDFDGDWRAYDSMTFGVDRNTTRYYPTSYKHRYNPPYTYESVWDYTLWEADWWNVVDWNQPFHLSPGVEFRLDPWLRRHVREF